MRRLSLSFLALTAIATPAFAHPRLVSSNPGADTTIAPTDRIEMGFSEKLLPGFVGATLDMTDMPGMRMASPMKMKLATAVGTDGTSLIATTPKPLPKGTYKLTYHIASSDTHRIEGGYSFKVQ